MVTGAWEMLAWRGVAAQVGGSDHRAVEVKGNCQRLRWPEGALEGSRW